MTVLQLNDKLVLKHFGQHPELGKLLKLTKIKTHAGMRYKEKMVPLGNGGFFVKPNEGKWVPNEITVDVVVALRCVSRGMWQVHVADAYKEQVEWYLIENCRDNSWSNASIKKRK